MAGYYSATQQHKRRRSTGRLSHRRLQGAQIKAANGADGPRSEESIDAQATECEPDELEDRHPVAEGTSLPNIVGSAAKSVMSLGQGDIEVLREVDEVSYSSAVVRHHGAVFDVVDQPLRGRGNDHHLQQKEPSRFLMEIQTAEVIARGCGQADKKRADRDDDPNREGEKIEPG